MLASELEPIELTTAEKIPQTTFGICLVGAQGASNGPVGPLTLALSPEGRGMIGFWSHLH